MILRKVRVRASTSSGTSAVFFLSFLALAACGLAPLPEGPTSFGYASRGVLLRGRPLAKSGLGFVRARPDDDARFGVPLLLSALERSAAQVQADFPRTRPLRIGDISGPTGGDHERHGSHRTGRDVDILFYLLDESGQSIEGSGFFAFDERGVSANAGRLAFFDTARNWALVRSLLTDPDAPVQWIFCADGIKARLLAYAAEHEPDAGVLLRASYVVHQPSYGNPHRDHFHVRIACTAEERARGCLDDGPTWPWIRNDHEKPSWAGPGGNNDRTLLEALRDEQAAN
jgi:penicillin-insensitive murein endopeptidase